MLLLPPRMLLRNDDDCVLFCTSYVQRARAHGERPITALMHAASSVITIIIALIESWLTSDVRAQGADSIMTKLRTERRPVIIYYIYKVYPHESCRQ